MAFASGIIVAIVVGALAVIIFLCWLRLQREKCLAKEHTEKGLDSRLKWKLTHRKSLRGNFIMKHDTPIEEMYYLENKYALGKGSFGVVVVGTHRESYVQYAIKTVMKTVEKRHRIERELRLMKDVDHVNIVRLFAVYETKDLIHFVMELCSGGTLQNLVDRQPKKCLPEQMAKPLIRQLVSAIAHMHQRGICHRDIKMQNILMENYHPNAQLKLIDFGFGTRFIGVTPLKTRCGTLYTTAPEVLRQSYDEKCDVWSGGVVAFILLCGKRPFEALEVAGPLQQAGRTSLVTNILMGRYSFRHPAWRTVSPDCVQFIQKMLYPDYRNRMSARQLLDTAWLSTDDASLMPTATLANAVRNLRRQSSHTALHQSSMLAVVFNSPTIRTAEIREMFTEFDTDHSGALSKEEFREAMRKMSNLSDEDIDHLFGVIDIDNDQQISFTEFLAGTLDPRAVDIEELNNAFRLLDRDNKGYITTDDLHRLLAGKKEVKRRHSESWTTITRNDAASNFSVLPAERAQRNQDFDFGNRRVDAWSSSDIEYTVEQRTIYTTPPSRLKEDEVKRRRSFAGKSRVMSSMQEVDPQLVAKIKEVMDVCDTNRDGVISYSEFLWAMADGDGLAKDEEPPTVVRGISRDDLASVEAARTSSEATLRRGGSEPNLLIDDVAVTSDRPTLRQLTSSFIESIVHVPKKQNSEGLTPKPSPRTPVSASPNLKISKVAPTVEHVVSPTIDPKYLFDMKTEAIQEGAHESSSSASTMGTKNTAKSFAKHRSASVSMAERLRPADSKNLLYSRSEVAYSCSPLSDPDDRYAMPKTVAEHDSSEKSSSSLSGGSGILAIRGTPFGGLFSRVAHQPSEDKTLYYTCSEEHV